MESKIRLVALCSTLFLFSCKQNSTEIPEGVISRDSMINIIVDLHLVDAVLQNPMTQSKVGDIPSNNLYKAVMKKYHISKERFDKSMDFYSDNPVMLDSMYDSVIEKLSLIQSLGYKDSLK
ncbi:MAG: DUF4296 domain-containing protein [Bacteroidales bacterium]